MKPDLILRVDGNELIGLGHIYRVLALAKILDPWFNSHIYIQEPSAAVIKLVRDHAIDLHVLPATKKHTPAFNGELYPYVSADSMVVLDGYHFDSEYQQGLKSIGCKLISIDDIYNTKFFSDVVINHTGGLSEDCYIADENTRFFLGPEYAILRPEFLHGKQSPLPPDRTKRLIITLGGADTNNITLAILHNLQPHLERFESISIIIGAAYQFETTLRSFTENYQHIRILKSLTAPEMHKAMCNNGIAICSASTVSYEYASVGGLLFILQTADNQKDLYKFLDQKKLALPLERMIEIITNNETDHYYNKISGSQKVIFDGQSDKRLSAIFLNLYFLDNIQLRKTNTDDLMIMFTWANDPELRQNSFSAGNISLEEHTTWFHRKLQDNNSFLYLFESQQGVPIGNIRFELKEGEYVLSYFIDPGFRNLGLSKQLLNAGIEEFFKEATGINNVTGFIKEDNLPSIKAFLSVGFLPEANIVNGFLKYKKTNKHV